MNPYPEHLRLRDAQPKTQAVGEFLDWLAARGLCIAVEATGQPCTKPTREILADWQDIDLTEIEREKRAMLDALRGRNEAP